MRQLGFAAIVCAAVGLAASGAQTQQPPPAQTAPAPTPGSPGTPATPTADPYANNAAPGATQFPLAAPAGKDSNARTAAPPGAVESGTVRSGDLEVRPGVQRRRPARRSGIR